MALTRFCFESLVRFTLRNTQDNPKSDETIVADVLRVVPSHAPMRVAELVKTSIRQLEKRNIVERTKKSNAFRLAPAHNDGLKRAMLTLATEHATLQN